MARKNKKSKQLNDAEDVSAETNENLTEPVSAANDASAPDLNETESVEPSTSDDLLDDVRRSLIEDESAAETQKQSKWWRRIGRGTSKAETPVEEPAVAEEIDLPVTAAMSDSPGVEEVQNELESEEYLDQLDELIDLLDTDTQESEKSIEPLREEVVPEPERVIDLEELKKQAFQPRSDIRGEETLSEVRSIALDGEDNVFVEVESTPQDPFEERVKALENALKPYRTYIYFAIAFLGVVIAGIALTIIYNVYQRSRPVTAVEQVSNLPFPAAVSLPGGWSFQLGKGTLTDGKWEPRGAEWLQGTEVCRWVALPWSRQLEAVVRTLNPDDPIELTMSNNDKLTYSVYSIRQMSPEEMQELDTNSPCLLIMLAESGAEKRWVLTALP